MCITHLTRHSCGCTGAHLGKDNCESHQQWKRLLSAGYALSQATLMILTHNCAFVSDTHWHDVGGRCARCEMEWRRGGGAGGWKAPKRGRGRARVIREFLDEEG